MTTQTKTRPMTRTQRRVILTAMTTGLMAGIIGAGCAAPPSPKPEPPKPVSVRSEVVGTVAPSGRDAFELRLDVQHYCALPGEDESKAVPCQVVKGATIPYWLGVLGPEVEAGQTNGFGEATISRSDVEPYTRKAPFAVVFVEKRPVATLDLKTYYDARCRKTLDKMRNLPSAAQAKKLMKRCHASRYAPNMKAVVERIAGFNPDARPKREHEELHRRWKATNQLNQHDVVAFHKGCKEIVKDDLSPCRKAASRYRALRAVQGTLACLEGILGASACAAALTASISPAAGKAGCKTLAGRLATQGAPVDPALEALEPGLNLEEWGFGAPLKDVLTLDGGASCLDPFLKR